jgi:hypothetical protein
MAILLGRPNSKNFTFYGMDTIVLFWSKIGRSTHKPNEPLYAFLKLPIASGFHQQIS